MKQRYAVVVLFVLIVASGFTSYWSYAATEQRVTADMRQALASALNRQQSDVITPDTIRTFNNHLHIAQLRGRATLSVGSGQRFRCYAQCPPATILSLSDQRPALMLWTAALLWGVFCWRQRRAHVALATTQAATTAMPAIDDGRRHFGGMSYAESEGRFFAANGASVHLTPMQQQLMELFFRAPSHRLTKQEICDALWPKKTDASETLYTLIRRLKPIVEQHSRLKITSDRGRAYQLEDAMRGQD